MVCKNNFQAVLQGSCSCFHLPKVETAHYEVEEIGQELRQVWEMIRRLHILASQNQNSSII
jgi:hypothetical protein